MLKGSDVLSPATKWDASRNCPIIGSFFLSVFGEGRGRLTDGNTIRRSIENDKSQIVINFFVKGKI